MGQCIIRLTAPSGIWYLKSLSADSLKAEFCPEPVGAKVFQTHSAAQDFKRDNRHIGGRVVNLNRERRRYT